MEPDREILTTYSESAHQITQETAKIMLVTFVDQWIYEGLIINDIFLYYKNEFNKKTVPDRRKRQKYIRSPEKKYNKNHSFVFLCEFY